MIDVRGRLRAALIVPSTRARPAKGGQNAMEKHFYIGDPSQSSEAEELISEVLERENIAREAREAVEGA